MCDGMGDKVLNLEGLTFGRYTLERLLGVGGFAAVYKARDLQTDATVGIKMLARSWLSNKQVVDLFVREGELASGLSHPNLITVTEVGRLYGQLYHVMEYIDGETLSTYFEKELTTFTSSTRLVYV